MSNQTVRLMAHNAGTLASAAQFIAELVRQSVTFDARHTTDAAGTEIIIVELTGGY
jgi:hypothetical protein